MEHNQEFFDACKCGDVPKVKNLLQNMSKKTIDATNPLTDSNPLFEASFEGHEEVVRLLIQAGAKIDTEGTNPLHEAAYRGHLEIVRLLINANANVNLASDCGLTPLGWAVAEGHLEVVRLLINANANVNLASETGCTPLCSAAQSGHLEIVRLLIASNARMDLVTSVNETPLDLAKRFGHDEVVQLLENASKRGDSAKMPRPEASEGMELDDTNRFVQEFGVFKQAEFNLMKEEIKLLRQIAREQQEELRQKTETIAAQKTALAEAQAANEVLAANADRWKKWFSLRPKS
jgi:ankyrin repeat protein